MTPDTAPESLIDTIPHQIAALAAQLKDTVGALDAQIAALQTQRNVLAAPLEEQLQYWRGMLTQYFADIGAEKWSLKHEAFTYSFFYREDVDKVALKALAVELPQVAQCLVKKPMAQLRLR